MSSRFWIYWAWVVPLTLATLGMWAIFGRHAIVDAVERQMAVFARHRHREAPGAATAAAVTAAPADGAAVGMALRNRWRTRTFQRLARVDTRAGDRALVV